MSLPKLEYFPVTQLVLYLDSACNMACGYCFQDHPKHRMTLETAEKAVEFYMSRAVSGAETQVAITFFGGEPFLVLDVMAHAIAVARRWRPNQTKTPLFGANTNGTIATPAVERIIRDNAMMLFISLDGTPEANAQRVFMSGRLSYPVVAKNLPKLVSWASQAAVRMTYHPEALDLVANVRHVLELGAPRVVLEPVVEARWAGHEPRLEDAWQAMADWFIDEARAGRLLPLEVTHTLLRQTHVARAGGARPSRPCGVGTSLIAIDPAGHIMPCHRYLRRPQDWLGTVDRPDFTDKRKPYLKLASRDILGCNTCLAEPVCGGGCRVLAMEASFDIQTGTHPGYCLTMRAHARAVYRMYDTLMAEHNRPLLTLLRGQPSLHHAFAEFTSR